MDTPGSGREEKMVEAVQGVVSEHLDRVEAQIDSTIDSAKETVHEFRSEAQEVADRTLTRFKGFWERTEKQLDTQLTLHPWIVLGGLLVVGYLLSRPQQLRRD